MEFWKHVQFCGDPKHQSAEYEINREYVHEFTAFTAGKCTLASC